MAENNFDTGILMSAGFSLAGASPLDKKFKVETIAERDTHATQNRAYEGMLVYVKEDGKTYQYQLINSVLTWKEFGFNKEQMVSQIENSLTSTATDKALAANQGKVLKGLVDTHIADKVVHITATERTAWNAKPNNKTDIGLANVTNDAQVKRSEMGIASGVATLDATGTIPASQLPSYVDDVLEFPTLAGFPVTGESGKIYVDTTTNKTYRWSGTKYTIISESIALGETSSTAYAGDKGKAVTDEVNKIKDGTTIVPKAANANTVNGLTVLTAVPASAKFTDTTYSNATTSANGLMAKEDKTKLDGLSNYVHPNDANTRHVTDVEKATWNAKASNSVVSVTTNGLMSAVDKAKLDGVEANANNYTHPSDTNTRHVTDAQMTTWNAKASTAIVTQTVNGLMSKEDKTKLDTLNTDDITYTVTEVAAKLKALNSYQITSVIDTIAEIDEVIAKDNSVLLSTDEKTTPTYGTVVDGVVTLDMSDINTVIVRVPCDQVSQIQSSPVAGTKYKVKAYEVDKGSNPLILNKPIEAISGATSDISAINIEIIKTSGDIALCIEAEQTTPGDLVLTMIPRASSREMTLTDKLNENIPATKITEDADNRFVSDTQINKWNSAAGTVIATPTSDGLMSKEDKVKLNSMIVKDVISRDIILTAAGWNTTTKSIDVPIAEFTGESILTMGPGSTITEAQYRAMGLARLSSIKKSNGVVTITYAGTKPTIDLPVASMIIVK